LPLIVFLALQVFPCRFSCNLFMSKLIFIAKIELYSWVFDVVTFKLIPKWNHFQSWSFGIQLLSIFNKRLNSLFWCVTFLFTFVTVMLSTLNPETGYIVPGILLSCNHYHQSRKNVQITDFCNIDVFCFCTVF